MMPLVHENGVKLNFPKQVDRIRDSYETFGIEVDILVVAHAHFAEAWEVKSELVQQGSQRYRDQDLRMAKWHRMAQNGTEWHRMAH